MTYSIPPEVRRRHGERVAAGLLPTVLRLPSMSPEARDRFLADIDKRGLGDELDEILKEELAVDSAGGRDLTGENLIHGDHCRRRARGWRAVRRALTATRRRSAARRRSRQATKPTPSRDRRKAGAAGTPHVDPLSPAFMSLLQALRARILETGPRNSCIESTSILLRLLRALGIEARALTVELTASTFAFMRLLVERGETPRTDRDLLEWQAQGAHRVFVGHRDGPPAEGWPGHLIAMTENGIVIDLAVDQVNEPLGETVVLGPVVVPPGTKAALEQFLADRASLFWRAPGGLLLYQARSKDHSYQFSHNWRLTGPCGRRWRTTVNWALSEARRVWPHLTMERS